MNVRSDAVRRRRPRLDSIRLGSLARWLLTSLAGTSLDTLSGTGQCGASPGKAPSGSTGPQQARCGYGPRQPLLVISPFAKKNFVDHHTTDQASILKFIEDNWSLGSIGNGSADAIAGSLGAMFDFSNPQDDRLLLDPWSGQPTNDGLVDSPGY